MANEVRLIDANLLARKWQSVLDVKSNEKGSAAYQTFELFIDRLKEEPTIDPETLRPKGRWIDAPDMDEFWGELVFHKCSLCDELQYIKTNYCTNCGADMREGGE